MKPIIQSYTIKAPVKKVWEALVKQDLVEKWSGASAIMDDIVGTKFSLWNGDIYGTNTKVEACKTLEQDWYGGKWEKASKVVITITEKDGITTIQLIHTDYPEESESDFAEGWKDYYFEPLKKLVEE